MSAKPTPDDKLTLPYSTMPPLRGPKWHNTPAPAPASDATAIDAMREQRDAFASGIANAALKAGILQDGFALTGPQLLLLCEGLGDFITALRQQLKAAQDDVAYWRGDE